MKKNNITELLYFTILEIRGEGSKDLLQGQITCDLEKLGGDNWLFGALCNPKGRVISSFILLSKTQKNKGNYWIIGQKDVLLKMYSVLEKYTPFYKVDMDIIDSYTFYGADFNLIKELLINEKINNKHLVRTEENVFILYPDGSTSLVILNQKLSPQIEDKFIVSSNSSIWNINRLNNLDVEMTNEISGKYTPHELNYDLTGRVDFDKGCYTGQEIVARMHYRAKSVPRLVLAESDNADIDVNMSIYNKKNYKVGSIVSIAQSDSGPMKCLISIKSEHLYKTLNIKETGTSISITKLQESKEY